VLTLALAARTGFAALEVQLSDGITTFSVEDNTAGDLNLDAGVVVVSTTIASWIVNVTTGISKPILGNADAPYLELNSVNVTSTAGGTLTIRVTDTDFTSVNGALSPAGFESLIGGTTHGTLTYKTYVDGTNAEFGTQHLVSSLGPFSGGAFSDTSVDYVPASGSLSSPFSATIEVQVTHASGTGTATSFDAEFVGLPEPAGLAVWSVLAGIGIGAMVLVRRKRLVALS
jgi:hypothetical protein